MTRSAEVGLFGTTLVQPARQTPQAVAVIDIGTSSIRMAIGEITPDGNVRTLEELTQAVSLGKDTFTRGEITRQTIEDSVRVLERYRELLNAYGISRPDQLRCVATSAVREASNKLAFIDRVYIATGFQVEPLDESEVSRITYLGIQPTLKQHPDLASARSIVVEVGAGSTEVLVVDRGQVVFSHTYNLGSLRLRQTLEALRTPRDKEREIMENHIDRFISQVMQQIDDEKPVVPEIIALGGDFRFAAHELVKDHIEESLAKIDLDTFGSFVNAMFPLSDDELMHEYHLTFSDAETLGPALLTLLKFARKMQVEHIRVSDVNLRDGLLQDMAHSGAWTDDFVDQALNSAIELGRKYSFDESHARHVAHLSRMLFVALQPVHRLDPRFSVLLKIAALLHEIGMYIGVSSYHKHSMYLIQNSELFGLSRRDLALVAHVARYHRRASPKPTHPGYTSLDREDRVLVAKLAGMLRIADALDRSYSQRIKEFACSIQGERLIISIPGVEDLSLEQVALKQTVTLFEETFGLSVLLRRSRI